MGLIKKILVIGESALDVFVYCEANRLAPDLPIPVLNIIETKNNPGMASNLAENIKSLGVPYEIITNSNWRNMTKTRYVHKNSNHTFFRVDSHNTVERTKIDKIPFEKYSLIAISDYNKGFLSESDISYICECNPNVFIDTKKILGDFVEKARYIKINEHEHDRSKKYIKDSLSNKVITTKGGSGAFFKGKRFPVKSVEVKDVSGAGDSFFAALVCKFYQTGNIEKSIVFANKCASEVVKHKGVTVIK